MLPGQLSADQGHVGTIPELAAFRYEGAHGALCPGADSNTTGRMALGKGVDENGVEFG